MATALVPIVVKGCLLVVELPAVSGSVGSQEANAAGPPPWVRGCWILTGPTASGKTEVGVFLAQALGAEIISMDSMALYRGMDIGTAKPSGKQRQRVPHHLIDVLDPGEEASVGWYLQQAQAAVEQIRRRGQEVLFVGGTPLYLIALLRGLHPGPAPDPQLRQQLYRQAQLYGPLALHDQLRSVDPEAAQRIHPNDLKRIVRALEFYRLTGQKISQVQRHFHRSGPAQARAFVLQWPRQVLYERINRRVEQMLRQGWVEEVAELVRSGRLGPTARQAVGYQEIALHLQGKLPWPEMVQKIQQRTRRYAKHQLTWFQRLKECIPVEMGEGIPLEEVVQRILRLGNQLSVSLPE